MSKRIANIPIQGIEKGMLWYGFSFLSSVFRAVRIELLCYHFS